MAGTRRGGDEVSERLRVVGISGPVGAGKSSVASLLAKDGAFAAAIGGAVVLVDADETLRVARRTQRPLRDAIIALHPASRLPDGSLDTQRLAAAAFADPTLLARLEGLQWPIVVEAIAMARSSAQQGGAALLLVEAIALVKSGLAAGCDLILNLHASREVRAARFVGTGDRRSGAGHRADRHGADRRAG